MDRKAVLAITLTLLLLSMLTLALNIQPVKASGTIYIRPDGSVEGTDKIQRNGDIYTFTDNIYDSIVVERDDIVVDGASYKVQGTGSGEGITLSGSRVTIKNMEIRAFNYGIWLNMSSSNSICGNKITNNLLGIQLEVSTSNTISGNNITASNGYGIRLRWYCNNNSISGNNVANNGYGIGLLEHSNYNSISENNITANDDGEGMGLLESSDNTIYGNNVANNDYGISLYKSSNNVIYHNNFVNNILQVYSYLSVNVWDDGYLSGGNYWSDYAGLDLYGGPHQNETGSDGIGDTPYFIDEDNQDNYPLMNPWIFPAEPTTWTVDDDGPADFHTIQEAINAANSGDTIFVHSGTYYENVVVNKTVSLIGENKFNTIVDGNNTGTVVAVTANNVNITEFTVRNGRGEWHSGIALGYVENCNISGNDISNNEFGLLFVYANNSRIANNNMTNNGFGIFLLASSNNTFRDNRMVENAGGFGVLGEDLSDFINDVDSSNTIDGKPIYYWVNKRDRTIPLDAGYVALVNCTLITIQGLTQTEAVQLIYTTNSTITNNIVRFSLYYSSNNIILRNNFTHSGHGIYLSGSSNNIISENNITANSMFGILLWVSSNNSVTRNNIADNGYDGIYLYSCSNNTITGNNLANNRGGIELEYSSNNHIYHNNFINNTYPVDTFDSENTWDNGFEGNYWSDYEENYPNAQEIDGSGIWDTPYDINWNNRDNLPLVQPWSPKPQGPAEATQELIETIETWNLPKGTRNSLTAKLKVAIHMLDLGKEDGAIQKLTAFINRVEMLREKTLTNEQANELVSEAQRIIDLING